MEDGEKEDVDFNPSMCMRSLKKLESEVNYLRAAQRKLNKDTKF